MKNFTITFMENGLENVQGFYCDAVNAGLRPDKEQGDVVSGDHPLIRA